MLLILMTCYTIVPVPFFKTTLLDPDIYSGDHRHELWMPKGHLHRLTNGPCYNSSKGSVDERIGLSLFGLFVRKIVRHKIAACKYTHACIQTPPKKLVVAFSFQI